jgi:hypothetical protein
LSATWPLVLGVEDQLHAAHAALAELAADDVALGEAGRLAWLGGGGIGQGALT